MTVPTTAMTGLEHYREAERLIREVETLHDSGSYFLDEAGGGNLAAAQVHATLALASAVSSGGLS